MSLNTQSTVQAGYFGAHVQCYGVLHRPGQSTGQGVVIVNDFGYRGMCAYWSFRRLAERLAAGGATVLRFDLPGTGDSPVVGLPGVGNRVECWEASVGEAVAFLRANEGLEQVTVVGFGVGALVAFNVAQRTPSVVSVELIQSFATGESYLEAIDAEPHNLPAQVLAEGRLISSHFLARVEEATLRALSATFGPREPALEVDVIAFDGDGSADFARQAEVGGAGCRIHASSDEARWMRDPLYSELPDFFEGIAERLQRRALVLRAVREAPLRRGYGAPDAGYDEEPVACVDDDGTVQHGVLSLPHASASPGALVFFFGTSANRRSAIHDNNTSWARALAEQGFATLRFDATGFGDSSPRPAFKDNVTLVERNYTDAAPLLAEMRRRGFTEFGAVGLSSGGYNAFQFALSEKAFVGVFGINVARFVLRETFDQAMRADIKTTGTYWALLRRRETWTRLLRGEVDARRIGAVLVQRLKARGETRLKLAVARLRDAQHAVLGQGHQEMLAFLGRPRARVQLVYAEGDRGVEEFEREFGVGGVALRGQPNLEVTFLPGIDHSLSSPADAARVAALAGTFFTEVFRGKT